MSAQNAPTLSSGSPWLIAPSLMALAILVLGGCQSSVASDERDMDSDASADAFERGDEDMIDAGPIARAESADRRYEQAAVAINARHTMAKEKCETLEGIDDAACISRADAAHAVEETRAIADRDAALAEADRRK